MKQIRSYFFLTALIILSVAATEGSAQSDTTKLGSRQEVRNANGKTPPSGLERAVFKQLIRLPYYGVFDHIAYKLDGDTVTLVGKVAVAINKNDAGRAVKRVPGVGHVINNIEVLPPSPFDDSIRRRTFRTLARSGGLFRYFQGANPSVRIVVDRGHVELEGYVANRGDYNTMNILANGVSDVFSVKNHLIIENEMIR